MEDDRMNLATLATVDATASLPDLIARVEAAGAAVLAASAPYEDARLAHRDWIVLAHAARLDSTKYMPMLERLIAEAGVTSAAEGLRHVNDLGMAAERARRDYENALARQAIASNDLQDATRRAEYERQVADHAAEYERTLAAHKADGEARAAAEWIGRPGAIDALLDQLEERAVVGAVVAAQAVRR
jgi:hypothetical protein